MAERARLDAGYRRGRRDRAGCLAVLSRLAGPLCHAWAAGAWREMCVHGSCWAIVSERAWTDTVARRSSVPF